MSLAAQLCKLRPSLCAILCCTTCTALKKGMYRALEEDVVAHGCRHDPGLLRDISQGAADPHPASHPLQLPKHSRQQRALAWPSHNTTVAHSGPGKHLKLRK